MVSVANGQAEPAAEQLTWGGAKFEIKHKSRCLQKSKLVNWVSQACRSGGPGPPGAGPVTRSGSRGWDEGYASSQHMFSTMFLMYTIFP